MLLSSSRQSQLRPPLNFLGHLTLVALVYATLSKRILMNLQVLRSTLTKVDRINLLASDQSDDEYVCVPPEEVAVEGTKFARSVGTVH